MDCPKCGSAKQRIPESRRTGAAVWRRRICVMCHHNWVTQEVVSDQQKLPTEIWSRPDRRKSGFTKEKKKFDTSGLAALRW
jgi:transcriptional regulator NrdR family protein